MGTLLPNYTADFPGASLARKGYFFWGAGGGTVAAMG